MGAPSANPLFVSDSPKFLQRQRLRASRATVSEHVPSLTCPCQKCRLAAKDRAVPGFEITVPGDLNDNTLLPHEVRGGAISSSAPASHPPSGLSSPKFIGRGSTMSNIAPPVPKAQHRDFFWLLQAVQECCPAAEADAADGSELSRKSIASRSATGDAAKRLQAESVLGKFGFKIPDTVILRKGKPRRRFSLDAVGKMQVEPMQSSAQLLRVLRRYVQIAQKNKPMAPAWAPSVARSSPSPTGAGGGCKVVQASRSEPALPGAQSHSRPSVRLPSPQRGAEPLREAAVLYYGDGAIRYMSTAEAIKQMENVSRLPREFWQHIMMLQMPVTTRPNAKTRYITYNFDAAGEGFEPEAPRPRANRRSNSITQLDHAQVQEGPIVAAVPRKINEGLAMKKGRFGNGVGIISGRFEFVLDESDGTLWLVNAEKLVVEKQRVEVEARDSEEDERMLYFKEEEFRELMEDQEQHFGGLKQRWVLPENLRDGPPSDFVLEAKSAADRLSGVPFPSELLKFYQAESQMLSHFADVKTGGTEEEQARNFEKAVGLSIWFKRWVKVHRDRRAIALSPSNRSARQRTSSNSARRTGLGAARARSAGQLRA